MAATALNPAEITREDLVSSARDLAPMLRDHAESAEKDRRISDEVFAELRARGFFRTLQPRRFGGFEFEPATAARVILELSAGCASTGWVAACAISHQWIAAQFPIECQEEIWADRADQLTVSSFAPTGDCVRVDGGFRLTGTWGYASGCDHADFALLGAIMPPENEAGKSAPGFIIVPISDCQRIDDWDTMGLAATGSHAVKLEDIFVPVHRSIPLVAIGTADTPGQAAFDTDLGKYQLFSVGAHCLATNAVGCLQGAFDHFVSALKEWETRGMVVGGGAKVMDYPAVQMRVGRAGAALKAAKALIFDQLEHSRQIVLEQGERLDRAERIDNRISQSFAVQLALQGLDELWGAAGSSGIRNAEVVQRAWRDAHAVAHHVSFNWDAVSAMYGQQILGMEPQGMY